MWELTGEQANTQGFVFTEKACLMTVTQRATEEDAR